MSKRLCWVTHKGTMQADALGVWGCIGHSRKDEARGDAALACMRLCRSLKEILCWRMRLCRPSLKEGRRRAPSWVRGWWWWLMGPSVVAEDGESKPPSRLPPAVCCIEHWLCGNSLRFGCWHPISSAGRFFFRALLIPLRGIVRQQQQYRWKGKPPGSCEGVLGRHGF